MVSIRYKALFVLSLTIGALGMPQRARPPDALKCSRDNLTSFQGRILEYKRGPQELSLRVRTDEETTESFTLKWGTAEKIETWLLLRGESFKAEDWKQVESAAGKLHEGMRIIVWACEDGSKPVFDWRPKE
jgi:hypothetical protein